VRGPERFAKNWRETEHGNGHCRKYRTGGAQDRAHAAQMTLLTTLGSTSVPLSHNLNSCTSHPAVILVLARTAFAASKL
jgi:hypothetical protein